MNGSDPLLARLFRENAMRCRRLAGKTTSPLDDSRLQTLAAEYERQAAVIDDSAMTRDRRVAVGGK